LYLPETDEFEDVDERLLRPLVPAIVVPFHVRAALDLMRDQVLADLLPVLQVAPTALAPTALYGEQYVSYICTQAASV
jgi:hypothetical protein